MPSARRRATVRPYAAVATARRRDGSRPRAWVGAAQVEASPADSTGACTGGAPGGIIVVGGVGSGDAGSSGGNSNTNGGCGLTYDDAACDACMQTSCCDAELACANDPFCSGGGLDACIAQMPPTMRASRAARTPPRGAKLPPTSMPAVSPRAPRIVSDRRATRDAIAARRTMSRAGLTAESRQAAA